MTTKRKTATADEVIVAPASPPAVVSGASAMMLPSLAQAQTDMANLTAMLQAWPAGLDPALQPVVQTLLRTVQGVVIMAKASHAMAQQAGLT